MREPLCLRHTGKICACAAVLLTVVSGAAAGRGPDLAINAASPSGIVSKAGAGEPAADASPLPLSFDARVKLGQAAERADAFKPYHSAMDQAVGDRFAATMQACFAAIREPDTAAFALVADIDAEGKATAIEVRPATNVARCFADGVAGAAFPRPPLFQGRDGFPITIEMRIVD